MFEDFPRSHRDHAGWQTIALDLGQGIIVPLEVFVCTGAAPGRTALVVAGIHGDEYEGPAAIAQLANDLAPDSVSGSVWLIPVANPLALAAGTRISAVDGANLARVFPGKAGGAPTERLAYLLFSMFAEKADYLIDLHSGGVEYEFLPVCGFYGRPGRENPSYEAACTFGLPKLWQLPETPGVLSREFTRNGSVAIGAEYLGGGRLSQEGVFAYAQGIKSCLASWQIWQGAAMAASSMPRAYENDWLLAPATGLFQACCRLGDPIKSGDELAIIRSLRGDVLTRIVAEQEGVVLGLRNKGYIVEGNWSVLLGREMK